MRRVLLAVIGLVTIEVVVLVVLASKIGAMTTFGLMVLTSAVGAWVAKHEGTGAFRRVRAGLEAGRIPAADVVDGLLVLVAGLLLLLPGFVGDVLGLALAVRPLRRIVGVAIAGSFARRASHRLAGSGIGGDMGGGGGGGSTGDFGRFRGPRFAQGAYRRPDSQQTGNRSHRGDDIIDLDADEYFVDEPRGEIGSGGKPGS